MTEPASMSNAELFHADAASRGRYARAANRGRPRAMRAPFSPLVEQTMLFGFFAAAAAFWAAVIWFILR